MATAGDGNSARGQNAVIPEGEATAKAVLGEPAKGSADQTGRFV